MVNSEGLIDTTEYLAL